MLREPGVLVRVHDAVAVAVDDGEEAGVVEGGFLEEQLFDGVESVPERDLALEDLREHRLVLQTRLGPALRFGPEVEAVQVRERDDELQEANISCRYRSKCSLKSAGSQLSTAQISCTLKTASKLLGHERPTQGRPGALRGRRSLCSRGRAGGRARRGRSRAVWRVFVAGLRQPSLPRRLR